MLRVDEYISKGIINAIPIKSLTLFKKPINLEEIRKIIPNFMPPQMYLNLDNHPELKKVLESQPLEEKLFVHEHGIIYYDNLAKSVSEINKTDEFNKINESYSNRTVNNILEI